MRGQISSFWYFELCLVTAVQLDEQIASMRYRKVIVGGSEVILQQLDRPITIFSAPFQSSDQMIFPGDIEQRHPRGHLQTGPRSALLET